MAYAFLLLVLTFTGVTIGYLWKNDFAKETLDVLFPAVGAILLSLYLGLKSIWIDRPDEKRFLTTVAVLHDVENGTIRGMAPRSIKHLPRFGEFTGAELIDTLPLYNDFKDLNLSAALKKKSETPGGPAESLVLDFVEYALLQWLIAAEQRIGYMPAPKIELISSAGGGGGLSQQLVPMPLPKVSSEPNILLRSRPVSLSLPAGSSVSRDATSFRRKITIRTRVSKVTFDIQNRAFQIVDVPIGRDAELIYQALGLPEKPHGLQLHGFTMELDGGPFPLSRFSKQAKMESAWIDGIGRGLDRDFSWVRLKALYTGKS